MSNFVENIIALARPQNDKDTLTVNRQIPGRSRQILSLALPAIASNITVPLLGLCDTAVSGHLGSALYLAAIAAGGSMINVVFWLCTFLRMGTTGLTASSYGAKDSRGVASVFCRSIMISILIGVIVVVMAHPLSSLLLKLISPDYATGQFALNYFMVCIWGTPALLVTMSINGWFVGMQNTFYTMIVSISVNVINILFTLTAVFLLDYGFQGVAIGTLAANWCGMFLALGLTIKFKKKKKIDLWPGWNVLIKREGTLKFFKVSGDLFLRSCCIMSVSLAVTAVGARLGSSVLAVNAVMMQFFVFFSYFMDGFAFSAEALCGKLAGAGDKREFRLTVRTLMIWGGILALIFSTIYLGGGKIIIGLLTDVADVARGADSMIWFVAAIPVVSVWAFLYDGIFIGLTATRRMLVTTILATISFFITLALRSNLTDVNENKILWIGFLVYLAIRGIVLGMQYKKAVELKFQLITK